MHRVALLDDYQNVALDMADWDRLVPMAKVTAFHDHLSDRDALAERLAPFDVIVAMRERTRIDEAILARLPRLKLITTMGRRNAAIDLSAAQRRGIIVAGTVSADSLPLGMPSFTWALILALTRGIVREAQSVHDDGWMTGVGTSLEGRTLGVLGLGRIGRRVAAIGQAFGMEVIAWSRNLGANSVATSGVRYVTVEELLASADVVTIHLVLSETTRGFIDCHALGLMKPSAFLVNTSRGPIVDESALINALHERRIAGAALDTFDTEPLPPGHPFRRMDNVLATPHIGFVTDVALRNGYRAMCDAVEAFLTGRPVPMLLAS